MASSAIRSSDFDLAIKSAISNLQDRNIKDITSIQKKVIFSFLRNHDTFACLPTGYGKSLIFQLAVRVAAELSSTYKDLLSPHPIILVLSPLNVLVKDQIALCVRLGIRASKIDDELPSF